MELNQEAGNHALLKKQIGLLEPDARSAFEQVPIPEDVQRIIAARPRTPYPYQQPKGYRFKHNIYKSIYEE